MFQDSNEISIEIKQKIIQKCSQILTGSWKKVSLDNLHIKRLKVGTANKAFHVKLLKPFDEKISNEPTEVIFRLNENEKTQNIDNSKIFDDAREIIVFYILSLKNMGPQLLGTFEHGRIEEYIPNKPIDRDQFENINIDKLVGQKLAQIHKLDIPITKKPNYFKLMFEYIEKSCKDLSTKSVDDINFSNFECKQMAKELIAFDFFNQVKWMFQCQPHILSPIVFCHNNVNLSNMLFKSHYDSPSDQLMIRDFELSSYNFRAYDLAFYINSKYYHPSEGPSPSQNYRYPNLEEQSNFCHYYLDEWRKENLKFNPELDTNEHLRMEIDFFSISFNLQIIGLGLVKINNNLSESFLKFSYHRFQKYKQEKELFLKKYGDPINSNWFQKYQSLKYFEQ